MKLAEFAIALGVAVSVQAHWVFVNAKLARS